jgi:hypothetical protein
VLHSPQDVVIEAKQLHLKDGAATRLQTWPLICGPKGTIVHGFIWIVDERLSIAPQQFKRFGNANRNVIDKTEHVLDDVVVGLRNTFKAVWPSLSSDSLLRSFEDRDLGRSEIHAFVVSEPREARLW